MLSRPLQVEWAGWRTDTYRLQQAGWTLNAEQDYFQNRMRLAMRHEGMSLMAMSCYTDFHFERYARDPMARDYPLFVMQAMGREVNIHEHGRIDRDFMFAPVDAQPCMTTHKITRLEDLAHFAAPLVRCNEVIIPEESVPELMERILKLQQPARTDRIRAELRRGQEGRMVTDEPQQKFHAQIISLAA